MPTIKNYYDVLGVPREASAEDIDAVWRDWRRDPKNHPDSYTDPKEKQRAEREFQERSSAYLVLHDPDQRSKHDEELDRAAGEAGSRSSKAKATAAAGAAAASSNSDPGSEQADWGDGPSGGRSRAGYAKPFKSYNTQASTLPLWKKYLRLGPMLIAAAAIVAIWIVFILIQPHASLPSNTNGPPVAALSPEATATPNPSPSVTPSPTPSATPEPCPGGQPTITNVTTQNGTITGTIQNLTSNAVQIGNIGFYVGNASTNNPPNWTDSLSSSTMSVSPSSSNPSVIEPGDSVTFTESGGWGPGPAPSDVSAQLNYPDSNGQMQSNWTWVDLPADCQQNS